MGAIYPAEHQPRHDDMTETNDNPTNTDAKRPAAPKGKRKSKLESLRSLGAWTEIELPNGHKVPYLAMPTPALQCEWNEALDKRVRTHLKAGGFTRVCAPQRDHPLHSDILRARVDELAAGYPGYARGIDTDNGRAKYRMDVRRANKEDGHMAHVLPIGADEMDALIESHLKTNLALWRDAFEQYRDIRNNPAYWQHTNSYKRIMCPDDGPPLPDGPPPPPVYVRENADIVLSVKDGFVSLWVKQA